MIHEASRQAARERLIVELFVKTIPQDMAAGFVRRLKTKDGKKEFAESWPIIVEAYFQASCNPRIDERRPVMSRTCRLSGSANAELIPRGCPLRTNPVDPRVAHDTHHT
jgi:hypothetical protein